MKAEIIAVGTELLLGQVVNTNATFLSEELASLGIEVYYHSVVGDNPKRLEELVTLAENRSDLIVFCGGLGPTEDDLTKQIVAQHAGQELVRDEAGYEQMLTFFKNGQRFMTENNLRQTLVFKDGTALPNATGLAIGIFYRTATAAYLLLPGPPSELKPMFIQQARPILQTEFSSEEQLISRVLRFYGIGESALVTELADLIDSQKNPTVAPYAKPNEVTLRLTVKTTDESAGQAKLDELEQQIQARVGEYFYGYGEHTSLAEVVVDMLKEKKKTVTAAESLTAGLFQATLGDISGVSRVFSGGYVTYAKETKSKMLGINEDLLTAYGTVSKECAEAMALAAQAKEKADYALSFTGVAGPDELENQRPGTVWIALATNEGVKSKCYHFSRDRAYVRHSAVMAGLDLLRKELLR